MTETDQQLGSACNSAPFVAQEYATSQGLMWCAVEPRSGIVRRLSLVRRQVREHRVVASLVMRSVLAAAADEWRASSHADLRRQCEWLRHRVAELGPYMGLAPEDVLSVIRLARHAVPMVEAWWHPQAQVRTVGGGVS